MADITQSTCLSRIFLISPEAIHSFNTLVPNLTSRPANLCLIRGWISWTAKNTCILVSSFYSSPAHLVTWWMKWTTTNTCILGCSFSFIQWQKCESQSLGQIVLICYVDWQWDRHYGFCIRCVICKCYSQSKESHAISIMYAISLKTTPH